jgi:hypothetical protein
MAFWC